MKIVYLSYIIDENTPTYGNRNRFNIVKRSDISKGDVANDSFISTTVHIGTHLDMPYHFYEGGQTIEDFNADFWIFFQDEILFIELRMDNGKFTIKDELINELEKIILNSHPSEATIPQERGQFSILNYKLLVVKTGICNIRDKQDFWEQNYGFHPDIANYLRENFPNIRVFGFDSISVSSFQNRILGREAHKRFLDPQKPILLLEDMDLRFINIDTKFKRIIVSPLRIAYCDGLPCTVFGEVDE